MFHEQEESGSEDEEQYYQETKGDTAHTNPPKILANSQQRQQPQPQQQPQQQPRAVAVGSKGGGEARIVAPHVSKLDPQSAVEVRLQSPTECVAVLCSVDVLKMRSGFFHDALCEQDNIILHNSFMHNNSHHSSVALGGGEDYAPAVAGTITNTNSKKQKHMIWREPITVPEESPYEAAAFLESLHEGRALFKGEWNFCWARLSVIWIVDELIHEFRLQIEHHISRLQQTIQQRHWRRNAAALGDMKIASLRKASHAVPSVILGVANAGPQPVAYSKVRVTFDRVDQFGAAGLPVLQLPEQHEAAHSTPKSSSSSSRGRNGFMSTVDEAASVASSGLYGGSGTSNTSSSGSTYEGFRSPIASRFPNNGNSSSNGGAKPVKQKDPFLYQQQPAPPQSPYAAASPTPNLAGSGIVAEPFWVKECFDGAMWTDPDDLFLAKCQQLKWITVTDKVIFWEMIRSLVDFPELVCHDADSVSAEISSQQQLADFLSQPEQRIIWTADVAQHLPREVLTRLIEAAYVPQHQKHHATTPS